MKKSFYLQVFLSLAVLSVAVGCRLKDVQTVTLHAADVRCAQCARVVIRALAEVGEVSPAVNITVQEGSSVATARWDAHARNNTAAVSAVRVRYDVGEIDVTYDSMKLAIKNLEFAIADAGYSVQAEPYEIVAKTASREALPKACQAHVRATKE